MTELAAFIEKTQADIADLAARVQRLESAAALTPSASREFVPGLWPVAGPGVASIGRAEMVSPESSSSVMGVIDGDTGKWLPQKDSEA